MITFSRQCFFLFKKKIFRLLFVFCFLYLSGFSQEVTPSLEMQQLHTAADSSYVDSLIELAWDNRYDSIKKAYFYAQTAYQTATQIHYAKGLINACDYLGQQMRDWDNYPKALSYYFTGLKISKENDIHRFTMRFYLLIGGLYDRKKEFPEALKWYDEAEKFARATNDSLYIYYILGNKAILLDKTGNPSAAYQLNLKSLNYLSANVGDRTDSISAFNNLALNQKHQHHYNKALTYLMKAKDLLKNNTDTFKLTVWYDNIGSLYSAMQKPGQAMAAFDTALVYAKKINNHYINEALFEDIGLHYEKNKQYENALTWYKKNQAIKDSIYQAKKNRQFTALRIQYDLGKKEALLSVQSFKLKQRKNLIIAILCGLVLLILLAITLLISNRKRKKNNQLLLAKNKQISAQQQKLQEVNHIKDRLFSIISHDLRSPMQSLVFYLKMLSNKKLDKEEIHTLASQLEYTFQQTRNMTDNLLCWASEQMNGLQVNAKNISFPQELKDVLSTVEPGAERKNIAISNQVKDGITLFSDPEILKLVLRNVLSNAVKFTPEGGRIILTNTTDENKTRISVSDNGIGIAPDMLKRFQKGDAINSRKGTQNEKGIGLGLSLSRQFLEKQGGKMTIESRQNHGTTIHLDFPAGSS